MLNSPSGDKMEKTPGIDKPSQINGSWGIYVQSGNYQEISALGNKMSLVLDCPCHYPAWNRNLFECKCNITFPYFMIKYAYDSGDWSKVLEIHRKGTYEEDTQYSIKES